MQERIVLRKCEVCQGNYHPSRFLSTKDGRLRNRICRTCRTAYERQRYALKKSQRTFEKQEADLERIRIGGAKHKPPPTTLIIEEKKVVSHPNNNTPVKIISSPPNIFIAPKEESSSSDDESIVIQPQPKKKEEMDALEAKLRAQRQAMKRR